MQVPIKSKSIRKSTILSIVISFCEYCQHVSSTRFLNIFLNMYLQHVSPTHFSSVSSRSMFLNGVQTHFVPWRVRFFDIILYVYRTCFCSMFLRYASYSSKLCFSNVPWAHFCKTFLGHISWVRFSKQKRLVSWPSCFTQHVSWTQMRVSSLQKQQRGQHRHTEASSRKYCREKSLGLPQKYERCHSENTKERHPEGKTPPWVKHNKQDRHQKAPERKHNKNR